MRGIGMDRPLRTIHPLRDLLRERINRRPRPRPRHQRPATRPVTQLHQPRDRLVITPHQPGRTAVRADQIERFQDLHHLLSRPHRAPTSTLACQASHSARHMTSRPSLSTRPGKTDGHQWGELMSASGEFRWPPVGIFSWPPSSGSRRIHGSSLLRRQTAGWPSRSSNFGRRRAPATRAICRTIYDRVGATGAWTPSTSPTLRAWCANRAAGLAEWTISGICRAANRVFKFARRHCSWRGDNPFAELETSERPTVSTTPQRRIYLGAELVQVIAAVTEPWRTLFRLASVVGGRESELLGLFWEDIGLGDVDAATIRFGFQAGRDGKRVPLKTEESKATLPLPRSTARMLLEHKARTAALTTLKSYVFGTRIGRPIHQRNVLRALYRAQERARTPEGLPTFPQLFEIDGTGRLVLDADGAYVLRDVRRRELRLPDFHALRHGAAMDCDDAEEARDLLRHKNSNVTRAIYRAHFGDRRRELLRARMETRMETSAGVDEPAGTDASTQQRGIEGAA